MTPARGGKSPGPGFGTSWGPRPRSVPTTGATGNPPVLPRQSKWEQGGVEGQEGSPWEMEKGSRGTRAGGRGRSTPLHPVVSPDCPQHPPPQTVLSIPPPCGIPIPGRVLHPAGPPPCPQTRTSVPIPSGTIPSPATKHPAAFCAGTGLGFASSRHRLGRGAPQDPNFSPAPPPSPRQSTTTPTICRSARPGMIKRNSWNNFSHPHIPARRGRGSAAGRGAVRQDEPSPPRRALLAPIINLEVCTQAPGCERLFRQESRRR